MRMPPVTVRRASLDPSSTETSVGFCTIIDFTWLAPEGRIALYKRFLWSLSTVGGAGAVDSGVTRYAWYVVAPATAAPCPGNSKVGLRAHNRWPQAAPR